MNNSREDLTLDLLNAIEEGNGVSQRRLAGEMGVALGLVNSYVKRCVRKGYIKIKGAPANRYLYYLTPKGLVEKSRLTSRYLSSSFDFYRAASDSCSALIQTAKSAGWSRIVLHGASELAEIAIIRVQDAGLQVVAVVEDSDKEKFVGVPVLNKLSSAGEFDCCLITNIVNPAKSYLEVSDILVTERILVPSVLKLHENDLVFAKSRKVLSG